MSPRKAKAPDEPRRFREDTMNYPSDRLTMRQLRMFCPDPEDLGPLVNDIRIMESNLAQIAYARTYLPLLGHRPVISEKDAQKDFRDLKRFYVQIGLASGDHAAKLLIQDIEEQARNQVPDRPRG
jgi:hypothetical protein